MAAWTLISVTSLPLMSISHICWDRLNSLWLVVSGNATSAGVSPEKKSARKGKSNYSDLLLFVVTVTKGLCLPVDIQTEPDLFSCQNLLLVPCSYSSLSACLNGIWTWVPCLTFKHWRPCAHVCMVAAQHQGFFVFFPRSEPAGKQSDQGVRKAGL